MNLSNSDRWSVGCAQVTKQENRANRCMQPIKCEYSSSLHIHLQWSLSIQLCKNVMFSRTLACVCFYVCVYVCMYVVCMYVVWMYVCMYVWISVFRSIYLSIYLQVSQIKTYGKKGKVSSSSLFNAIHSKHVRTYMPACILTYIHTYRHLCMYESTNPIYSHLSLLFMCVTMFVCK
jgi:hypothetical protein